MPFVASASEKHHYLPVFYLKEWAGPDGRICEYSRPYDVVKPKRVHPGGTGYVRGLYAIEGLPAVSLMPVPQRFPAFCKCTFGAAFSGFWYGCQMQEVPVPQREGTLGQLRSGKIGF